MNLIKNNIYLEKGNIKLYPGNSQKPQKGKNSGGFYGKTREMPLSSENRFFARKNQNLKSKFKMQKIKNDF